MRITSFLCISVAGLASACVQQPPARQDHLSGVPNPATVYCQQQGGQPDLATGSCRLPSGAQVDQWDLYYKDHPRPPAKPTP